jgi:hypothetical protein
MRNYFVYAVLIYVVLNGYYQHVLGQNYNLELSIYVKAYESAKKDFEKVLAAFEPNIITIEESGDKYSGQQIRFIFQTDSAGIMAISDKANSIGVVTMRNYRSINIQERLELLSIDIRYLEEMIIYYQKQPAQEQEKKNIYINEVFENEKKLFKLKKEKEKLESGVHIYYGSVFLAEEHYTPKTTNIDFVNMPGAEYRVLRIETQHPNLSAAFYRGGGLRYMFTRGKSAVSVGVLKAENFSSETAFTELFYFNFGQDFYSRYLGRGRRRFLNVYTGYTAGGVFATGNARKRTFFQITPHIGIELFKSRHVLLDLNAGYLIPFYENRNLRGWTGGVSFNFVF